MLFADHWTARITANSATIQGSEYDTIKVMSCDKKPG